MLSSSFIFKVPCGLSRNLHVGKREISWKSDNQFFCFVIHGDWTGISHLQGEHCHLPPLHGQVRVNEFKPSASFQPLEGGSGIKLNFFNPFRLSVNTVGYAFMVVVPVMYFKIFKFRMKQDTSVVGRFPDCLLCHSILLFMRYV